MSKPLGVVVTRPLPTSFPRELFEERVTFTTAPTGDELRKAVQTADVLYSWDVPSNIPAETPHLRWIELPSAGADHLRGLPVWDSDITITSSRGVHIVPMADHLFAMLLSLTRQIPAFVRAQDKHDWLSHAEVGRLHISELRGMTMGIVGWGKIGDGIAHLADAFGMRVLGTRWSIHAPREVDRGAEAYANPPWLQPEDLPPNVVFPAAQLHDVLDQSDVVVLLLPLTPETHHSFGPAEFGAMRRGTLFFNLGRGSVVNDDALVAALRSGRLAGAGLDVTDPEPLPRTSPLWSFPQVIISPHVAGMSRRTGERAANLFAVNLSRYLEGRPLLNVVDRHRGY
ncbi:MAG TPA: D-2-hydroxyacid dehydrogenase [Chloroflexota bacterium]|nr:D-2-hydroxyacid dehydrogenase [Chloroflexota bacterium]